ncbi:MAG TPA: AraC family transcriptional regulator [Thermoclostridium sp.]
MNYIDQHLEIDDMQCYILSRKKPGHIFMLVNASEETLLWENFEPVLKNLYNKIQNDLNIGAIIAAGSICNSVLQIPDSEREAMSCIYYGSSKISSGIIRYNDIDVKYITDIIPDVTATIVRGVKSGNTGEIQNVMSDLRMKFKVNYLSRQQQSFIIYDILTTMQKYIDSPVLSEQLNEILSYLLNINAVNDEILSAVEDICIAIANQRKETQSSKNNELLDAIKNYIMEHLCDSMLSLDSIAEGCGISSSYLSRFFKANMGCTTMQYVESLRMDMVKDKLRNTDDPLKKILTETGYVDQSGFIRRFKQLEGMTPISYRKSYREMA